MGALSELDRMHHINHDPLFFKPTAMQYRTGPMVIVFSIQSLSKIAQTTTIKLNVK